jgi:general secretion pathway protein F
MPIFQYRAYNAAGKEVSGDIEAPSLKEATERLRNESLFPKTLSLQAARVRGFGRRERVSLNELAATTRQLSTLISSGSALFDALSALSAEEENATLANTLVGVKESISGGSSLSKALEAHRAIFPEMYIRTVEAGEASGTLDKVLARLADYLESRAKVRDQVRTALLYPAVMTVVGFGVLFFLFLFVLPKITGIFADTKQALPFITIVLLTIVRILRGYWFLVILGAGAAFWGAKRYMKTPKGRESRDRFFLSAPLTGKLFTKFYMAGFARTLGSLLESGIPILSALEMTRRVLNQSVFEKALTGAIKDVTEGMALSASLKNSGVFPGVLVHLITTGEKSGDLPGLLLKAAASYEREFESSLQRSLTLLEPALILAMGVVVGFIVLAILLPIFELNQVIR